MSFRGRGGRGGGRGGRGGRGYGAPTYFPVKHSPHEDFPEIALPPVIKCGELINKVEKEIKLTNKEAALIESTKNFEEFMRNSCYHLELDAPKKKNDGKEIKRFSDRKPKTYSKREPLKSYLKLTPRNFPAELLDGFKQLQPSNKKRRWDNVSVGQAFEAFEKLEEKHSKDGENKAEKDGEEEDVEDEEEVEEEESSDDDYNQGIEFDDDDDDWNQEEEALLYTFAKLAEKKSPFL
ncbi:DNA-directed RNA polymerase III subunit RPC7-like [Lolium rigidum]|uniref:DNA-directed RNA polymerase III subunit RPC7-like n=1 Tax=Lolium rigidum TaxID=89674 RepID=UPI001F5CF436|nr:DNA-directed RNA polymerase III subunit RPC7-like [Lolium rigidum]